MSNPLILGTNSIKDTGFDVANSLRFDDGSTDYLRITPSSASNRTTFTFSTWIKRASSLGNFQRIFEVGADTTNRTYITFDADDKLEINHRDSGVQQVNLTTTAVFRDVSAWYHIVFAVDTTQGTDTNRIKIYVNGTQQTSLDSTVYPSSSKELDFNSTQNHTLGADVNGGNEFDGYMAEVVMIDGTALDPTSFGEFDEDTGIWKPIDVSGLTFGTNGFYLPFENSGSLGADVSGNGNNFTVNNLTSIDQSTDTCTNNFCTNNSIAPDTTGSDTHAFSNGNLVITTASNGWWNTFGTIGITTGKWYYEYLTTGSGSVDQMVGFVKSNFYRGSNAGIDVAGCYSLYAGSAGNGTLFTNSATGVDMGTSWAWTFDDIVMVAIDASSGKVWYGKNGTWFGSGNPATGANEAQTVISADLDYGLLPAFSGYHSGATALMNFGSPSFAISSGNSDGNGFGQFEYQPPSGYLALCTKNLATDG